jgi:hypothetical protein
VEPKELAAAVIARYDEQAAAYHSLLEVAGQIRRHLQDDQLDKVQELFSRQVELMAAVDAAGEKLAPLRRQLGACFGHPDLTLALLQTVETPPALLREVGEAMQRVAALLSDLSPLYADNQQLLQERLGTVRSEQATLVRARSAVQAYRGPSREESRFVDKKS